jgi:cytochrome c2
MVRMRKAFLLFAAACVVVASPLTAFGQDAKLERGKYLVEEIAKCQECHTAKTETGELNKSQWMKGATLIGVPATPPARWHQKSPDISSTGALWTRWGADGFSKFLQTGKTPTGSTAGPPMPVYMMKAEDADAITAFLKSLP